MIHPRTDYNGIQDGDETTSIKEDEPVFVLRAQDALAPACLEYWADMLLEHGGDEHTADNIYKWADTMREWAEKNGNKIPDTPTENLCA